MILLLRTSATLSVYRCCSYYESAISHYGERSEYKYGISRYDNTNSLKLNSYGMGPFCKFSIPDNYQFSGVYCILENGRIKYIGECYNLSQRFNAGYGNISPRNCYVNGQSTNCRINMLILNSIKSGNSVDLFFYRTNDTKRVEYHLIKEYSPAWNVKDNLKPSFENKPILKPSEAIVSSNHVKETINQDISLATYKYEPLYNFLKQSKQQAIKITYHEIEQLLGSRLPKSAYIYSAWWANGVSSHSHSTSWGAAGYDVAEVAFGDYVVFRKK